ncbi:hypothetical protein JOM56_014481 [Amanita muscaria]
MAAPTTEFAPVSLSPANAFSDTEPSEEEKMQIRERINQNLQKLYQNTEELFKRRMQDARSGISKEYHHQLELERQQRKWAMRQPIDDQWKGILLREQSRILESFKSTGSNPGASSATNGVQHSEHVRINATIRPTPIQESPPSIRPETSQRRTSKPREERLGPRVRRESDSVQNTAKEEHRHAAIVDSLNHGLPDITGMNRSLHSILQFQQDDRTASRASDRAARPVASSPVKHEIWRPNVPTEEETSGGAATGKRNLTRRGSTASQRSIGSTSIRSLTAEPIPEHPDVHEHEAVPHFPNREPNEQEEEPPSSATLITRIPHSAPLGRFPDRSHNHIAPLRANSVKLPRLEDDDRMFPYKRPRRHASKSSFTSDSVDSRLGPATEEHEAQREWDFGFRGMGHAHNGQKPIVHKQSLNDLREDDGRYIPDWFTGRRSRMDGMPSRDLRDRDEDNWTGSLRARGPRPYMSASPFVTDDSYINYNRHSPESTRSTLSRGASFNRSMDDYDVNPSSEGREEAAKREEAERLIQEVVKKEKENERMLQRKMDEVKKKEDEARKKEEEAKKRVKEASRKEEEAMRKQEEAQKLEEEARRKEEEAKRQEEEAKRREEEARRKEDEARLKTEEVKSKEEEAAKKAEEARRKEDEAKKKELEARRKEREAHKKELEAKRKESEARRKESEARRKESEARRKESEARRKESEARRKESEAKRLEEEARCMEEDARRREEETEKREEEIGRREEEALHLEEEMRQKAEEITRREEELNKREEELDRREASRRFEDERQHQARLQEEEMRRQQEEEEDRQRNKQVMEKERGREAAEGRRPSTTPRRGKKGTAEIRQREQVEAARREEAERKLQEEELRCQERQEEERRHQEGKEEDRKRQERKEEERRRQERQEEDHRHQERQEEETRRRELEEIQPRVVCVFNEQDVQLEVAARAEQLQQQQQQPQQYHTQGANAPLHAGQPGANTNSAFNFPDAPQQCRTQLAQQGLTARRLQGELQKSKDTGAELHNLTMVSVVRSTIRLQVHW